MNILEPQSPKTHITHCIPDLLEMNKPPLELYRLDSSKGRMYFSKENGDLCYYPGITSVIKKMGETPEFLIEWMMKQGSIQNAKKAMNMAAYIGSTMHTLIAHHILNNGVDIDEMKSVVQSDIHIKDIINLGLNPFEVSERLGKNILSFEQFMIDHKVQPLAIELPLRSPSLKVASMVDFICTMEVKEKGYWGEVYKSGKNKGEPKETTKTITRHAIVDFKSGMKTYQNTSHELQLAAYNVMVKENYPEYKEIDFKLYNWHPNDWIKTPTYSLLDQTDKHSYQELKKISELYHMSNNISYKKEISTHGYLKRGGDITENYKVKTFRDIANEYFKK